MEQLRQELTQQFDEETEYQHEEIRKGNERMGDLEEMLN